MGNNIDPVLNWIDSQHDPRGIAEVNHAMHITTVPEVLRARTLEREKIEKLIAAAREDSFRKFFVLDRCTDTFLCTCGYRITYLELAALTRREAEEWLDNHLHLRFGRSTRVSGLSSSLLTGRCNGAPA